MEQQEAADYCSLNNGCGVPGVRGGGAGGSFAHQGARGDGPTLLGLSPDVPVDIECNNEAAIALCKDRKKGQRVRHIDIIHYFVRDHVASGALSVYCKSEDNVSDCLNKALTKPI
jgi:hypothetical protein